MLQKSNVAQHCFISLNFEQSTTGVVTQCDTCIRGGIEFDVHDITIGQIINKRSFMNKENIIAQWEKLPCRIQFPRASN